MELLDITESTRLRREAAADKLRQLADSLSRHNEVAFTREGLKYSVRVPDEVTFSLEIEIGGEDGSEIEIEIKW
ncbi:MAG: amphi-Trp domain-containing protein [Acidimicrobiales bacterium]